MANHRLTKEELFRRFREKHGEKYTYEDFDYEGINMSINIFCPQHGWFRQKIGDHVRGSGCNKCGIESQRRKISTTRYGVCVYDIDNVGELTSENKTAYIAWRAMTQRCYDPKRLLVNRTYIECEVCDEWKRFSGFVKWFKDNYVESYELDKDILSSKKNKLYSPQTCCFVPHEINTLINKCDGIRGDLPIGVRKSGERYVASMRQRMKEVCLGRFSTKEEAFNAYKNAKELYVKRVAQEYYDAKKITERVYDALMNYKVEITD